MNHMTKPKFLENYDIREWMMLRDLDKIFTVRRTSVTSYTKHCSRKGYKIRTIRFKFRIVDILAHAYVYGHVVEPTRKTRLDNDLLDLERLKSETKKEISALNAVAADIKHKIDFGMVVGLTDADTREKDEIVAAATNYAAVCGVYFLIADGEIVYVGQSVNVFQRMYQHTRDKTFDQFCFIRCPRNKLDALEALYMRKFSPKYNLGSPHFTGLIQLRMSA